MVFGLLRGFWTPRLSGFWTLKWFLDCSAKWFFGLLSGFWTSISIFSQLTIDSQLSNTASQKEELKKLYPASK